MVSVEVLAVYVLHEWVEVIPNWYFQCLWKTFLCASALELWARRNFKRGTFHKKYISSKCGILPLTLFVRENAGGSALRATYFSRRYLLLRFIWSVRHHTRLILWSFCVSKTSLNLNWFDTRGTVEMHHAHCKVLPRIFGLRHLVLENCVDENNLLVRQRKNHSEPSLRFQGFLTSCRSQKYIFPARTSVCSFTLNSKWNPLKHLCGLLRPQYLREHRAKVAV